MTQIDGFTDYIGPSGGSITQGDLYLIAHPRVGDGNIHVSGKNMFVYLDGPDSGDGSCEYRGRGNVDIMCSGRMSLITNTSEIILGALQSVVMSGANCYMKAAPVVGEIEIWAGNKILIGSLLYDDNFTPEIIGLYSRTGDIEIKAQSSVWGGIGPWGIEFDGYGTGAGNILLTTVEGKRVTMNSSGIATMNDLNPIKTDDLHVLYNDTDNSGVTNISVGSGMFYAVSNPAGGTSGISAVIGAHNLIPWEKQYVTSLHYGHDPDDKGINTFITILRDGLYKIEYTVGTDTANGNTTRTGCEILCVKNSSSNIPGSKTWTYNRTFLCGYDSASWTGYIWLQAGDTISIEVDEYISGVTGDNVIRKDACSICLTFMNPGI